MNKVTIILCPFGMHANGSLSRFFFLACAFAVFIFDDSGALPRQMCEMCTHHVLASAAKKKKKRALKRNGVGF